MSGCETRGPTWVNTNLGNVKRSLDETFHAFVPRDMAEFQYRRYIRTLQSSVRLSS